MHAARLNICNETQAINKVDFQSKANHPPTRYVKTLFVPPLGLLPLVRHSRSANTTPNESLFTSHALVRVLLCYGALEIVSVIIIIITLYTAGIHLLQFTKVYDILTRYFCFCDLDLDPMTLVYKLDLMYPHTKNKLSIGAL